MRSFSTGDDKISYGKQRVWGAIGWGLSTLLVGVSVDWYSRGSNEKNYFPAHLIAMTFLLCHFVVASKLEVSFNEVKIDPVDVPSGFNGGARILNMEGHTNGKQ